MTRIGKREWIRARLRWIAPVCALAALAFVLTLKVWETTAPPRPPTPSAIMPALAIMARTESTAELRRVLDSNDVAYSFVAMPPGTFGHYTINQKVVEMDLRLIDEDPVTLAALLAHEATHARDAVSGYLSIGGANACIDSELRAFRASAQFWSEMYGPAGKPDPADDLQQQMNLVSQYELRDPAGLERLIRQTYVNQCG